MYEKEERLQLHAFVVRLEMLRGCRVRQLFIQFQCELVKELVEAPIKKKPFSTLLQE